MAFVVVMFNYVKLNIRIHGPYDTFGDFRFPKNYTLRTMSLESSVHLPVHVTLRIVRAD